MKMMKKDNKNFQSQCQNDMCTTVNVFLLKIMKMTKSCDSEEIKGLNRTFYYLWDQIDIKKQLKGKK